MRANSSALLLRLVWQGWLVTLPPLARYLLTLPCREPQTQTGRSLRFIHRSERTLIGFLPTYSTTPDLTKMGAT